MDRQDITQAVVRYMVESAQARNFTGTLANNGEMYITVGPAQYLSQPRNATLNSGSPLDIVATAIEGNKWYHHDIPKDPDCITHSLNANLIRVRPGDDLYDTMCEQYNQVVMSHFGNVESVDDSKLTLSVKDTPAFYFTSPIKRQEWFAQTAQTLEGIDKDTLEERIDILFGNE